MAAKNIHFKCSRYVSPFPDTGGTRRSEKFRKHTQPSFVLCKKAVKPQTRWDGGAEQSGAEGCCRLPAAPKQPVHLFITAL